MRIQVLAVAGSLALLSLVAIWQLGPSGAESEDRAFPAAGQRGAGQPGSGEAGPLPADRGGALPSDPGAPAGADSQGAEAAQGGAAARARASDRRGAVGAAAQIPPEIERFLETSHEDDVRESAELAGARLHAVDPEERIDAIDDLAFLDPERARPELESLLAGESDPGVRREAFEALLDLLEHEGERIDWMLRGLSDPSDAVREHIAYSLSIEDTDAHPGIVPALRQALRNERNPDVFEELENALEMLDPGFVTRYQRELEELFEDPNLDALLGQGAGSGNG